MNIQEILYLINSNHITKFLPVKFSNWSAVTSTSGTSTKCTAISQTSPFVIFTLRARNCLSSSFMSVNITDLHSERLKLLLLSAFRCTRLTQIPGFPRVVNDLILFVSDIRSCRYCEAIDDDLAAYRWLLALDLAVNTVGNWSTAFAGSSSTSSVSIATHIHIITLRRSANLLTTWLALWFIS